MKRLLFLTLLIMSITCAMAQDATPESVIQKWEKENKADLTEISSFMLKIMGTMVGKEGKDFIKKTKKLSMLDLNDCSADTKARYRQYFEKLQLKGYLREEKANDGDGNKVIVFVKMEKDVITNILSASLGTKDYVLTLMKGNYDAETMKGVAEAKLNIKD